MILSLLSLCLAGAILVAGATSITLRAATPVLDRTAVALAPRTRVRFWLFLIAAPLPLAGHQQFTDALPSRVEPEGFPAECCPAWKLPEGEVKRMDGRRWAARQQ